MHCLNYYCLSVLGRVYFFWKIPIQPKTQQILFNHRNAVGNRKITPHAVDHAECEPCGVWTIQNVDHAESEACRVWTMRSVNHAECEPCGASGTTYDTIHYGVRRKHSPLARKWWKDPPASNFFSLNHIGLDFNRYSLILARFLKVFKREKENVLNVKK